MSSRPLKLGTRGSELARTQSETVAASLRAHGFAVDLTIIRTAGDRDTTSSFGSIGPQGVFVREIEQALVEQRIDLAVHSFKDLPTKSPPELVVAAVPERVDPADLLLVRRGASAARAGGSRVEPDALGMEWPLPQGARVGTASARRRAWLLHARPDLVVLPLRGNVPTRVRKLEEEGLDAIMLAAAGINRLNADAALGVALERLDIVRLDPARFVAAPAQGALALQCRQDDAQVVSALAALDHAPSHIAVRAERTALARAEGGCDVAFGAHCVLRDDELELTAMLERAGRVLVARAACPRTEAPETLGATVWRELDAAAARGRGA